MERGGGTIAEGFEAVRDSFVAGHPPEVGGAQLCVYRGAEPVVDLWIGRDPIHDRPFDETTITVLMSCTKGALAILVHVLAEHGRIELERPIASWWPEFAANGKDAITLSHVLSHTSGLFAWEASGGQGGETALDWAGATDALAQMRTYWTPGQAYLYHFITYGFLIGEVVRRATGKSVGRLFDELIARPLGLNFWIGLPDAEEFRVAPHIRSGDPLRAADLERTFASQGIDVEDRLVRGLAQTIEATETLIDLMLDRRARAAEIPAANGVGDARSLARLYAATIGEVDGIRLLSAETVDRLRQPQTDHLPAPAPLPAIGDDPQRFGLGFELPRRSLPMLGAGSFGHPGAGGRIGFADPESGYSVGYAYNGMLWDGRNPDPRWGWLEPLGNLIPR